MTDRTFDTLSVQLAEVERQILENKGNDDALDQLVPRFVDMLAQCIEMPAYNLDVIKRKVDLLAAEDYIEPRHLRCIRADLDRLTLP